MSDLFSSIRPSKQEVYPETFLLSGFAKSQSLWQQVKKITQQSPFRKMLTPNGHYTNIAFTNCGDYGWTSNIHEYCYSSIDPDTKAPWPPIPTIFLQLAKNAAQEAGYANFLPDACLINHYVIGSKLSAHQDKNEKDFSWPIISISLGLSAVFQIFGFQRHGTPTNIQLYDGDVMVWGGKSRLIYHGVKTLQADQQNPIQKQRINITLRKVF